MRLRKECLPDRFGGPRSVSTAIYFLLKGDQFSAFHRLKSDEIWHFYEGSALKVYAIDEDGRLLEKRLGANPDKGESFQVILRAGWWFGAAPDDPSSYTLIGCTVAPGFEYDDFELGSRGDLIAKYPEHRSIIERLTR